MKLYYYNYFTMSPHSMQFIAIITLQRHHTPCSSLQQVNSTSESDAHTAFFVVIILVFTYARSLYTFDHKSSQYLNSKTVRVFKNVQPLVHLKRYHMQKKREKSAKTQIQVM
jgi:hypothetical protein